MKKLALLFTFVLAVSWVFAQKTTYNNSWGKSGYSLQEQSMSNLLINFSITEFELVDTKIKGESLKNIVLPEAFLPNDEGAPDLPGTSRFIAIPEESTPVMKIVDYRTEVFKNIEMAPAMRIPLETEDGIEYNRNKELYSKNAFYPAQPFQLSEVTEVRGVDAVILGITPFQYNPVTRELIVYRDVKVEIKFEGGNGHVGDDRLRSRWFDPILEDVFINYESLPKIDYNAKIRTTLQTRDDVGFEYLIVVPNYPEFSQWADSVQKFRQEQGILTGIVTLNEIGGSSTTILENYFNNAYNTWDIPPVAVLLLADYGTNAANSIVSPIWNSYCASDNIYADVDYNNMPDIIFARITANNSVQLQVMVNKFIDYERNPPTNPNFYMHPITALGWQTERWFQICSETIGGFWREMGKEPVRINAIYDGNPNVDPWSTATNTTTVVNYFGPNGLNYIPASPAILGGWSGGTAAQVNNAINNGAFMLQHRDHGYEQGWGEPAYSSTDINSCTNTDLCFIFSINCLTGKYNMSGECFTEKFHRHTAAGHNSGALGLIGASEVSYSFVNDAYVWGMFDNMWPEFMPAFGSPVVERGLLPAFGNAAGKYFLQQSSWPYNTSNKEVTYNLFHHHGDAFLTIYSEVPQNLTVTHNAVLFAGENTFTVTADAGSFIALTVNGHIIGTDEGTGSPLAIEINPQLPPNFMKVTVTKQNYYRYESMVEIIPMTGPYVIFDSYSIDDTQSGNGNGLMDYGENILLNVTMKNAGIEIAENITVTITTEDEFVTITDGEASFGNINANSSVTLPGAFALEASPTIPDMHTVFFEVSANDGTDSWTSYFAIIAHAPLLEICSIAVSDPGGNNNNMLDPGENANIIIHLTNSGSSLAPSPVVSFISTSPFVTVSTGTLYPADLTPGSTVELSFSVSVLPSAPIGTVANFVFTSQTGELVLEENIGLKIGLILEDFETADFSKYEWEFAGNANWTVTNISPQQGTYCAKSGDINDNQSTSLLVTMEVVADDEISFFKKVSSEASYDYLQFFIDGAMMDQWSGTTSWGQVTYPVTTGTHAFKWTFMKDASMSTGSDCGWIDYILFPTILTASNIIVNFSASPTEVLAGDPISFTDLSTGQITSWQWDFQNDGTIDSYAQNPVFTYETAGVYSVKLTVEDANGNSSELIKQNYITVFAPDYHFLPIWSSPYNPMTFYILKAAIDEIDLESGAEVGIFDIDPNSNEEICVGAGVIVDPLTGGNYLEIIASMDDGSVVGQANGFTPGHDIIYKLWSETTGETSTVMSNYPYPGYDEVFASQGSAFAELNGFTTITQEISLQTGWNLMSFRVEPENWNMLTIVQPLIDQGVLFKVLNETGGSIFHLPFPPPNGQWSNTIGDMANTEGYYVKVTGEGNLSLEGFPVETPMDIPLTTGWNIISYPCEFPQNALTAVQPLINAGVLYKVIDEEGGTIFHLPFPPPNGQWSNTIGNFENGKGYYVKVTGNATLNISCPSDSRDALPELPAKQQTQFFQPVWENNPYMPMHIVVYPNEVLVAGDEIGVFDGEICVGASVYDGNVENPIIIVASMDDPETGLVEGYQTDFPILIRHFCSLNGVSANATFGITSGDEVFAPLGTTIGNITNSLTDIPTSQQSPAVTIYPNPGSDNINITIGQSGISEVYFTLFSATGKSIIDGQFQSENQSFSVDVSHLNPGCYYIKLEFLNVDKPSFYSKIIIN